MGGGGGIANELTVSKNGRGNGMGEWNGGIEIVLIDISKNRVLKASIHEISH